MSRFTLR